jgi:hypothetical protein
MLIGACNPVDHKYPILSGCCCYLSVKPVDIGSLNSLLKPLRVLFENYAHKFLSVRRLEQHKKPYYRGNNLYYLVHEQPLMVVRRIYNIAVVMVAIQTAERKFQVHIVPGPDELCIMAGRSDQAVNFLLGNLPLVIDQDHPKRLCFYLPLHKLYPLLIRGAFNPVFAHDPKTLKVVLVIFDCP